MLKSTVVTTGRMWANTRYVGHRAPFIVLSAAVLAVASFGCASSGTVTEADWSRSYASSWDRVWQALLDTLAEGDYVVESEDAERGRVRIVTGSDRSYRGTTLVVQLSQRGEMVIVSVQGGGGSVGGAADYQRIERIVLEFLHDLDATLRVPPGAS
jgi:hypothetical protein